MVYWLEKQHIAHKGEKDSQIIWERYAVCGRRELLERVRAGQEQPKSWRILPAAFGEQAKDRKLAG